MHHKDSEYHNNATDIKASQSWVEGLSCHALVAQHLVPVVPLVTQEAAMQCIMCTVNFYVLAHQAELQNDILAMSSQAVMLVPLKITRETGSAVRQ